jgi:hypothetical protein
MHFYMGLFPGLQKVNTKCGKTLNRDSTVRLFPFHTTLTVTEISDDLEKFCVSLGVILNCEILIS